MPRSGWVLLFVLALGASACGTTVAGSGGPMNLMKYERPGLPPPGPAVGDGGGLVSRPGGPAVNYQRTPVVHACELLTPGDIADLGLLVRSGTAAGMVRRSYLGQTGTIEPYTIGIEGPNRCSYGIDPDLGSVEITVHQPVYSGEEALRQRLSYDYLPPVDVRGVRVHQRIRPYEGYTSQWLRVADVHVELVTGLPDDVERRVVDHVLARLPAAVAAPTGPLVFDYVSPVLPDPFVNACAISRWSDAQHLAGGVGPSAAVEEFVSPGIGWIFHDGGLQSNYVHHSCRYRAAGDLLRSAALTVRTTSYDDPATPAAAMAFQREYHGSVDTTVRIGEESNLTSYPGATWLQFRRGLVIVEVEYSAGDTAAPPSDLGSALESVARSIDARVPR